MFSLAHQSFHLAHVTIQALTVLGSKTAIRFAAACCLLDCTSVAGGSPIANPPKGAHDQERATACEAMSIRSLSSAPCEISSALVGGLGLRCLVAFGIVLQGSEPVDSLAEIANTTSNNIA